MAEAKPERTHIRIPMVFSVEDLTRLKQIAKVEVRSAEDMLSFMIRTYGQTTNTSSQQAAFNPIKSEDDENKELVKKYELKKRKRHLIPDGIPVKVVMDDVVVRDTYDGEPVELDKAAVIFYEKKGAGGNYTLAVQCNSRFKHGETGEPVDGIWLGPVDDRTFQTQYRVEVLNPDDLIVRWLDGEFEEVSDWDDFIPRMVRVKNDWLYRKQDPLELCQFVPSAEQMAEYRERGWSERQIAAFIKARSSVIPGGPDYARWLARTYQQIDNME